MKKHGAKKYHENPDSADIQALFVQTAGGLKQMFDMGIIHHDIKLDNIFVDLARCGDGSFNRVFKIADFGQAHIPILVNLKNDLQNKTSLKVIDILEFLGFTVARGNRNLKWKGHIDDKYYGRYLQQNGYGLLRDALKNYSDRVLRLAPGVDLDALISYGSQVRLAAYCFGLIFLHLSIISFRFCR